MKNVQIPEQLFMNLVKYFLLDVQDEETRQAICKGLTDKLNAMTKHELYTKYKTAPTPEEQEEARIAYLDKVGLHESFRQ